MTDPETDLERATWAARVSLRVAVAFLLLTIAALAPILLWFWITGVVVFGGMFVWWSGIVARLGELDSD